MIRRICALFALLFALAALIACGENAKVEMPDFCEGFQLDYKKTLAELCAEKECITVGFIGGSVTEGGTYSGPIMEFLRQAYPENVFTEVNAAWAGTTSYLGVHRMDDDLLVHEPDIVFIEFSVNDPATEIDGFDSVDFFSRTMEGLVRKTLKNCESTLVVMLGVSRSDYFQYYDNNTVHPVVAGHMSVAEYYNIPFINISNTLIKHLYESGDTWDYYFADGVHPNENGGKFYADVIWEYLQNYEWDINFKAEPLTLNDFERSDVFRAVDYVDSPWIGELDTLDGHYPSTVFSDEIGSTIEFDFYGSTFGIIRRSDFNSGMIEYSIDGGEWKKVDIYNTYYIGSRYTYTTGYQNLETSLERTNHHIVIRIAEDKNEQSSGNVIRIGAFLFEHD